ncbi:MAG: hypothetical protein E3J46_03125 [Desulfobacteraceae bacterium]|nr:MAG: hypothetical protein E3J46_03125 [Desulfobacteraceae bacterium]
MLIVKVLHIAEEKLGDIADFAGRQRDAVFIEKSASNFFTLAVMDKSLKAYKNHDVITNGSARNDMVSKQNGPSCNQAPRSISASGRTNMDAFADLKLTMTDCLTVMRDSLLDMPWATTDGTLSWIVTNRDEHA